MVSARVFAAFKGAITDSATVANADPAPSAQQSPRPASLAATQTPALSPTATQTPALYYHDIFPEESQSARSTPPHDSDADADGPVVTNESIPAANLCSLKFPFFCQQDTVKEEQRVEQNMTIWYGLDGREIRFPLGDKLDITASDFRYHFARLAKNPNCDLVYPMDANGARPRPIFGGIWLPVSAILLYDDEGVSIPGDTLLRDTGFQARMAIKCPEEVNPKAVAAMKLAVDGQRRRWLRDHDIGTKARWLRDAMMGFEAYAGRTAARLLWGETQKELIYVAGAEVYTHLLTGGRCPPLTAEHLDDVYHPLLIFGKNILSADQLRIAIGCFANYASTEPGVPGGSFARPFRTPSRLLLICSQFRTACNANPLTHAVLNGIKKGVILPLLTTLREQWLGIGRYEPAVFGFGDGLFATDMDLYVEDGLRATTLSWLRREVSITEMCLEFWDAEDANRNDEDARRQVVSAELDREVSLEEADARLLKLETQVTTGCDEAHPSGFSSADFFSEEEMNSDQIYLEEYVFEIFRGIEDGRRMTGTAHPRFAVFYDISWFAVGWWLRRWCRVFEPNSTPAVQEMNKGMRRFERNFLSTSAVEEVREVMRRWFASFALMREVPEAWKVMRGERRRQERIRRGHLGIVF